MYYTKEVPLGKLYEETAQILSFCANMLKHPHGRGCNSLPDAFLPVHQQCSTQCIPVISTPPPPSTQFCKAWSLLPGLSAAIAMESPQEKGRYLLRGHCAKHSLTWAFLLHKKLEEWLLWSPCSIGENQGFETLPNMSVVGSPLTYTCWCQIRGICQLWPGFLRLEKQTQPTQSSRERLECLHP